MMSSHTVCECGGGGGGERGRGGGEKEKEWEVKVRRTSMKRFFLYHNLTLAVGYLNGVVALVNCCL